MFQKKITVQSKNKDTINQIILFLLGYQSFFWLLFGGSLNWWHRPVPFLISNLLNCIILFLYSKKIWKFDYAQMLILYSGLFYIIYILFNHILYPVSINFAGIKINKSIWEMLGQLFLVTLLLSSFINVSYFIKYTENGRTWLTIGILSSILKYAVIREVYNNFDNNQLKYYLGEFFKAFINPNAYAHVINIGIILCLTFVITNTEKYIKYKEKIVFGIIGFILVLMLAINSSRGGMLSLGITILLLSYYVYFLRKNKRIKRIKTGTLFAYIIAIFGLSLASLWFFETRFKITNLENPFFRLDIWSESLRHLKGNSLLGVGINTFKYSFNSGNLRMSEQIFTHAENSFLTVSYEQGIIAGIGLFLILITYIWFSFQQKNRSWRTSCIGISVTFLFICHSMYENIIRFPAIQLLIITVLSMLHGRRSLKSNFRKKFHAKFIKTILVSLLGASFIWYILNFNVRSEYDKLSHDFTKYTDNIYDLKSFTIRFDQLICKTPGEIDRLTNLVLKLREQSRNNDIVAPDDKIVQTIEYFTRKLIDRQNAEPYAWQTLALCEMLLEDTVYQYIEKNKCLRNLNSNTIANALLKYGVTNIKILNNKPSALDENILFIHTNSSIIKPIDFVTLIYIDKLMESELIPIPETFKLDSFQIAKKFQPKEIMDSNQNKLTVLSYRDELGMSGKNFLDSPTFSYPKVSNIFTYKKNECLSTGHLAAENLKKSLDIFIGYYRLYTDAIILLGRYLPEALSHLYYSLSHQQQETFWNALRRFYVYEHKLSQPAILSWIANNAPTANERLKAVEQLPETFAKDKETLIRNIYLDLNADPTTRLRASDLLSMMKGSSVLITDFPPELENSFVARAKRYIASVHENHELKKEFRDKLKLPEDLSDRNIIKTTAKLLIQEGQTEIALNILRKSLELNDEIQKIVNFRNEEVKRRQKELGLEPDSYLVRLSVLAKSNEATSEDILYFLNQAVLLERELLGSEFIKTFKPNEWSKKDILEYLYYKAKIERSTRNDEEMATLIDFLSK